MLRLQEVLANAEDDVKNGSVAPISETLNDLRTILFVRKSSYKVKNEVIDVEKID